MKNTYEDLAGIEHRLPPGKEIYVQPQPPTYANSHFDITLLGRNLEGYSSGIPKKWEELAASRALRSQGLTLVLFDNAGEESVLHRYNSAHEIPNEAYLGHMRFVSVPYDPDVKMVIPEVEEKAYQLTKERTRLGRLPKD